MSYCEKYYHLPNSLVLNLDGTHGERPMYSVDDVITPNPVSMADSPKWVHNAIPRGQLGYLPHGHLIVSPFGIKRIYRTD